MPFLIHMYRKSATLKKLTLLCAAFAVCSATAQTHMPQEYEIKGAFIFQFSQFVDWPAYAFPDPSTPFVIGIVGEDPFGSFLDELVENETVEGHPIELRRYENLSEVGPSHILFISKGSAHYMKQTLEKIQGTYTLTVSDISGFAKEGGMIRFYINNNKIKFQVNVEVAKSAGLVMSSKLLRLADICCNGDD